MGRTCGNERPTIPECRLDNGARAPRRAPECCVEYRGFASPCADYYCMPEWMYGGRRDQNNYFKLVAQTEKRSECRYPLPCKAHCLGPHIPSVKTPYPQLFSLHPGLNVTHSMDNEPTEQMNETTEQMKAPQKIIDTERDEIKCQCHPEPQAETTPDQNMINEMMKTPESPMDNQQQEIDPQRHQPLINISSEDIMYSPNQHLNVQSPMGTPHQQKNPPLHPLVRGEPTGTREPTGTPRHSRSPASNRSQPHSRQYAMRMQAPSLQGSRNNVADNGQRNGL